MDCYVMNKNGELIKTTVEEFIRKRLMGKEMLPLDNGLGEKDSEEDKNE